MDMPVPQQYHTANVVDIDPVVQMIFKESQLEKYQMPRKIVVVGSNASSHFFIICSFTPTIDISMTLIGFLKK